MNSITNYKNSSLNSNYSSKIVRPNTEKFGKLIDIAKNLSLTQIVNGYSKEGTSALWLVADRIEILKRVANLNHYNVEDRENAIKALESKMKRWKYNKNLQDLDFDLNFNYAIEALKPLKGQALIDVVNGKKKVENNCRMDYDAVFGKKESLVNKVVEAPPVVENSAVSLSENYETKSLFGDLWSRVSDYVNDVREGLKERKLSFANNYGRLITKMAVPIILATSLGLNAVMGGKLVSDYLKNNELKKLESQSRVEMIEQGKKFVPSIGVEQQKPIEIVAEAPKAPKEKIQVDEGAVPDVKPIEKVEKAEEKKSEGIEAKFKYDKNNIKSVSVPGFKEDIKLYSQGGIVHGVVFTSNVEKGKYREQARINSHQHAAGGTRSRRDASKLEETVTNYRMKNNLGVDEEGYITKSLRLPEKVAYLYVEQLAEELSKAKEQPKGKPSVSVDVEKRVKGRLGDELANEFKTYFREQAKRNPGFEHFGENRRGIRNINNRAKEDLTAAVDNIYNALNDLGDGADQLTRDGKVKRHGRNGFFESVGGFAKNLVIGALDIAGSPLAKEGKFNKFKKGIKGMTFGSGKEILNTAGAGVHVLEDIATAGVKTIEVLPDIIIGNFQSGADLTSGVSNLAQASINTAGDTGIVGLAFYKNPVAGAVVIAGSDGSRDALSMDINRLIKLDLTGAPLVHNILHNGGYFVEGGVQATSEAELRRAINDNYEKTLVRDGFNTALTIRNIIQLEQKSEDYRNKGRGDDDKFEEGITGKETPTTETPIETTTIRRPQRNENFDFENNDDLIDRPGDIGSDPTRSPNTHGM